MSEREELRGRACRLAVHLRCARGVRLVCWDFDQTILAMHSGGHAAESEIVRLARAVSPSFLALSRALHDEGIVQGIATFADAEHPAVREAAARGEWRLGGAALVEAVLRAHEGLRGVPFSICAFWPDLRNRAMARHEAAESKLPDDKNAHLREIMRQTGFTEPRNVMLIDDSAHNIDVARRAGFETWLVDRRGGGFALRPDTMGSGALRAASAQAARATLAH